MATVSHDLRTPLNGIIGMMNLVKERVRHFDDDLLQKHIELSLKSTNLLLFMINDILDFSQISNGKLRLSFTNINILELVKEVMDLIEFQAREKGIQCKILCSEQSPLLIFTDGNRIRQVLLNLLSNALKFTSRGINTNSF